MRYDGPLPATPSLAGSGKDVEIGELTLNVNGPASATQEYHEWCFQSSPRWSMYGIFGYISPMNDPNVGKYTIHGSFGSGNAIRLSPQNCRLHSGFFSGKETRLRLGDRSKTWKNTLMFIILSQSLWLCIFTMNKQESVLFLFQTSGNLISLSSVLHPLASINHH